LLAQGYPGKFEGGIATFKKTLLSFSFKEREIKGDEVNR
jgi:hypothetical protein